MDLAQINSHDSWSPLQEVWLGDVYPASWYDHLAGEIRDIFYRLTEITQQDLAIIQKVLIEMNITVRRPGYHSIDAFLDQHDQLIKPAICPRDNHVVIGSRLIRTPLLGADPWQKWIDLYRQDTRVRVEDAAAMCVCGANVVRAGKDIIIDRDGCTAFHYDNEWPEYRVKVINNGGHLDGCFAIIKPGLILANHYFAEYEENFPGWEIIMLDHPTYGAAPSTGHRQKFPIYNGKFWDTTVGTNRSFNQHIIDHALDWVGMYTETYFELNCLVIDEHNVLMLAENAILAETLAQRDVNVHWVPFRSRCFWDGAVHCLTVDIRRNSTIEDYFPARA